MLKSEAIEQMKLVLGFRRNLDSEIGTCLKTAQIELETRPLRPWFLKSEDSSIRMTIGEQRIPYPSDFIQEYEEGALIYVPDDATLDEVPLIKNDMDELKAKFARTVTGEPQAYAESGEYFRIFPIPDAAYLLKLNYYQKDSVLSVEGENKWLKYAPMLLMGVAGQIIAASARDEVAKNEFTLWERRGLMSLNVDNEAHKHINRRYQIGGEE